MKAFAPLLALGFSLASAALAGPLQTEQIPADAKWLLHLDVDNFRSSQAGGFFIREVLQKQMMAQMDQPLADIKQKFKLDIDPTNVLAKIKSITVFGTDYEDPKNTAVVLIKTDPDLQTIFVGVLAGLALAGTNAPMPVEQSQQGDISFYSMGDQVQFAVEPGAWVLVGKTKEVTQKAVDALTGKAPSLKSATTFSKFEDIGKGFFFLGVAEGFSADKLHAPQAKLLQMADGGRVVLGENAGKLFVNLALEAKTEEVVLQMQQVVQGLIALASLSKSDDKDVAELIESIKVSANNKTVSLNLDYPVDKAIEHFKQAKITSRVEMSPTNKTVTFNVESPDDAPATNESNKSDTTKPDAVSGAKQP